MDILKMMNSIKNVFSIKKVKINFLKKIGIKNFKKNKGRKKKLFKKIKNNIL
jgi:hypothetical protein